MSEYVEKISNEDLIKYWKTFFDGEITIEEINKILETISNTNFERIIDENRTIDTKIVDSFEWNEIKNEKELKKIFKNIKDKNFWVYFFEPILKKYVDEFIDIVKISNIVYDVESFLSQSISALLGQLHIVAYQTIIAEIYYAKKSNLLKGNTKEERGKYFSDVLLKDNNYRKEIYLNYSELARILDIKAKYCIEFIIKILNDTNKEISNIEAYLNDNKKLGKIKEMHMGEGDTHNNGKTVVKLVFDTNITIMYKPHNLDIDKKYNEFIQWINDLKIVNDSRENLLAAKVYTTKDSGWTEFIEYMECEKEEELQCFYYRVGKLLCLLHTLNGNDMHYENLIAHKDMPVLIDLETLLHPDLYSNYSTQSAMEVAIKEVRESVTSTHLLPSKIINTKNDKILDIGGLGASEEQEAPFIGKFIENYGTDEVKIAKAYGKILPKKNNPTYEEKKVDAKKYREEIICGFKNMYTWILENKDMYENKVQSLFENCEIRALYRATNVYAQLLMSSFHPDLLTNYADRYVFLHRIAIDYKEKNHKIINLEIKDIMQGDIPCFTAHVNGKQIHNMHLKNIDAIFKKSTIEKIREKIESMSEVRMYRQIAAINTSFMTKGDAGHLKTAVKFKNDAKRKYDEDYLVKTAMKIADYMLQRSIIGEKLGIVSRMWLGAEDLGLGFNIFTHVGGDIYTGLSGIAMFYNYLWKESKNSKYKEVVKEIIESILETLPKDANFKYLDKIKNGAFNGLGGIAYVLFYIDESNDSNIYTNDILNILDILDYNIKNFGTEDIINGVGNLGIVISIYEKTKNKSIKSKAITICEKIYKKLNETKIKIKDKPGISWNEKGYVGYSHGNAGIIAQLYRWYSITNDDSVLKIIEEALLYERSMYSDKDKDWYRSVDEQYFTCGWCHGSSGILLSKVQLKKLGYENEKINNEIMRAIDRTIESGLNKDISLCHGDMGNMVILKEAAIVLNDNRLYSQAVSTIEEILDFIVELMNTESFKGNEYNGFMIGLSGIAYEILRIGKESKIPNVLGLE
ncbi:type 2 lantibiotic biosynthesis protein [Clostridium gelidum]|uniref:Type 2 lantibiotic biosynthesis protein n=1 Tax=Clostridium gelidum TaxID=704125 RepID=A0ABN6ITT4_9CLOT|nr:type 2 lanthipeptide synthetase LanM family protein [Clostridium gelidum]BCZ44258.1 type 2 lantibiotic biosynthesis protein [Clostridium gelidum]